MSTMPRNLSAELSRLSSKEKRTDYLFELTQKVLGESRSKNDYIYDLGASTMPCKPPEDHTIVYQMENIIEAAISFGIDEELQKKMVDASLQGLSPYENKWSRPIETIPCANVKAEKKWKCDNRGSRTCSGCRLVRYCSEACKKAHWITHKRDCKSRLNSNKWKPRWVIEQRIPEFALPERSLFGISMERRSVGAGHHLWGNVPAIDLLELQRNEGDTYTNDLSIACIASGDLRHLIRTVNGIPDDYPGKLTVLLNDVSPFVSARNLLLLLVLGGEGNPTTNADIALHLWYSTFLPVEYATRLSALSTFIQGKKINEENYVLRLQTSSGLQLSACMNEISTAIFSSYLDLTFVPDIQSACNEYQRVMFAGSRGDFRDRYYAGLRPAHRLAVHEYRMFGLLLPFGAANSHFNMVNGTLFGPDGEWLQDDGASPLEGWNLDDVVAAGKSHGATAEDIFGCLYFYLSDQLQTFIRKIQRLDVNVKLFDQDCQELFRKLCCGALEIFELPKTQVFDRIEVSNIVDENYIGFTPVLKTWGTHLNAENSHATLVGYSLNWAHRNSYLDKQRAAEKGSLEEAVKDVRLRKFRNARMKPDMFMMVSIIDTLSQSKFDHSQIFAEYLKKQKVQAVAQSVGLKMKNINTLVAPRIGVPLGSAHDTVPFVAESEVWLDHIKLSHHTLCERFIEFKPRDPADVHEPNESNSVCRII